MDSDQAPSSPVMNGLSDESTSSSSSGDESPVKEKEEKTDKDAEDDAKKEEKEEQEMVLIQDTGFNVKIVVPGMSESIELPVSIHGLRFDIKIIFRFFSDNLLLKLADILLILTRCV